MNILTLFARIGLKADTAQADRLEKQFKGLTTVVKGVVLSMVGVSAAIYKVMDDSMKAAVAFKQFEAETGASSEELQKWQAVAGQTNVSTEALSEAVKNLADNRQKIKLGQGNISGFQLLGINPDQDPFALLEELKKKTEGLAPAMKKTVLSQMGISAQLIQVLELTNSEFAEMKSNAFVIPKSAINDLAKANAAINTAGKAVDRIRSLIAQRLAPEIVKITKLFVNWIKENKEGIVKGFKTAFDMIVKFIGAVMNVANIIGDVVSKTIGWKNALGVLVGAFLFFNRALLLSPIGMILAGLTMLILLIDDFQHYQKGDKRSIFGDLAKLSPVLKSMFGGISDIFEAIAKTLAFIFQDDTKGMDKLVARWGVWGEILKIIGGALKFIVDTVGALLTLDFDKIGKMFGGDFFKKLKLDDKSIVDFFSKTLGLGGTPLAAPGVPSSMTGNSNSTTTYTDNSKTTIQVSTSADANATAKAVIGKQIDVNERKKNAMIQANRPGGNAQ